MNVPTQLAPFASTVLLYFVLWLPEADDPTVMAAIIKCLPVLCLCVFVWNQGPSLQQENLFKLQIFIGLCFSLPGDFFLVWEFYGNFFLYGVGFFATAHVFYSLALGFSPLRPILGMITFSLVEVVYYCYLPNLEGLYVPIIAIYMGFIGVVVWRAIARLLSLDEGKHKWSQMFASFGALIFGLSDFILGTNKWLIHLPYARVLIMVTYWIGQMLLALSTTDLGIFKLQGKQN